ncbi:hypothetical protein QBC44DRAFT_306548 [Cladorrhinum sp. PSN332]|nr:hypothetical protein QBC44DRAFT_306548 [Cladorrhinum sp. PSN332]
MVLFKALTLFPLAVGAFALAHEPLGKRSSLDARQGCTRDGWIPACPGVFKCVPPGAICCSDGVTYAMPPRECPSGQTPLATAPLSLSTASLSPPLSETETETISISVEPTTVTEAPTTEPTETATITDEVTETGTESATETEDPATITISLETETGLVTVEPMPTPPFSEDVGTASWTVSSTPGLNGTVTVVGPSATATGVVTAGAGKLRGIVGAGLVGLGVGVVVLL